MKLFIYILLFFILLSNVIAVNVSSADYKTNIFFSSGGSNITDSNTRSYIYIGQPVTANVTSTDFKTKLGFFIILDELIPDLPPGVGGTGSGRFQDPDRDGIFEACPENISLLNRIISRCKFPDNSICDDGEWAFIDSDCKVNLESVRTGDIFMQMWLLRILIILALYMFSNKDPNLPLIIMVLISLFILNDGFNIPPAWSENCDTASLGRCIWPSAPLLGWILLVLGGAILLSKITSEPDKKKGKKKGKDESSDTQGAILPISLIIAFFFIINFNPDLLSNLPALPNLGGNINNLGAAIWPSSPLFGWIIISLIGLFFLDRFLATTKDETLRKINLSKILIIGIIFFVLNQNFNLTDKIGLKMPDFVFSQLGNYIWPSSPLFGWILLILALALILKSSISKDRQSTKRYIKKKRNT